jgi:hypothetical protein
MNSHHFDDLSRSIAASRRALFPGMLAIAAGWVGVSTGEAKKKHKHKHKHKPKKAKLNEFGCVNVGDVCQTAEQCCSGICAGKKGTKTCQAHDVDVCEVGQDSCAGEIRCTIPSGPDEGFCFTTTGNAPYCGALDGECFACAKDAECVPFCGAGAACVRCPSCQEISAFETACIGHDQPCAIPQDHHAVTAGD